MLTLSNEPPNDIIINFIQNRVHKRLKPVRDGSLSSQYETNNTYTTTYREQQTNMAYKKTLVKYVDKQSRERIIKAWICEQNIFHMAWNVSKMVCFHKMST